MPGRILSGASLTAPQMALVPCGCPDPPHTGDPPAPPGTTSQQQPGVPAALGCQLPHPCPLRCP